MKTVRPSQNIKISRDDFSPVTYLVREHEERLAVGRQPNLRFVTPWQPAGTIAQSVFQAARSVSEEDRLRARRRWPARKLDPRRDMTRLRRVFSRARFPAARWSAIQLTDLQLFRLGVESILGITRHNLPGDEWWLRGTPSRMLRQKGRASISLEPLDLGWPEGYQQAVWEGISGSVDVFRTTPLGATIFSANYGVARGGLRLCRTCWAFFVPPRGQWSRRHCNDCRALRPSVSRTRGGLAVWKQQRWQKVQDRMRKRGFARLGYTTPEAQDNWRATALGSLHGVSTSDELDAWEKHLAPMGRPGRPRKTPRETERGEKHEKTPRTR